MTKRGLTKEQIKAIADRAEGKESETVLRTFVCKDCEHEIIVKPTIPKYETPTICGECWEKRLEAEFQEKKKRETPMTADQALKMLQLGTELLKGLDNLKGKGE